jgi:hypothetical protein
MTLNIENWKKLRDQVARWDKHFNMGEWLKLDRDTKTAVEALKPSCGTVACLAGTAYLLRMAEQYPSLFVDDISIATLQDVAATWLGLGAGDATYVFCGHWFSDDRVMNDPEDDPLDKITRADVLAYLDHVIATGELDTWTPESVTHD